MWPSIAGGLKIRPGAHGREGRKVSEEVRCIGEVGGSSTPCRAEEGEREVRLLSHRSRRDAEPESVRDREFVKSER